MKGKQRHAHAAWAPSSLEEGQTSCKSCVTTLAARPSSSTSPDRAHCHSAPMAPEQLHDLCMQAGSQPASPGRAAARDQLCRYGSISNYPSPPQPASSPTLAPTLVCSPFPSASWATTLQMLPLYACFNTFFWFLEISVSSVHHFLQIGVVLSHPEINISGRETGRKGVFSSGRVVFSPDSVLTKKKSLKFEPEIRITTGG